MTLMDDVLRLETVGDVRVVVLNRPRARNALNGSLITALHAALAREPVHDLHLLGRAGERPEQPLPPGLHLRGRGVGDENDKHQAAQQE